MLLHFLSLVPDVISLTSIRLTTEPISKSYLGPAITGHCGPLEATHPQMGHSSETPQMSHPFSGWISVSGLTYPLSLCRTNPWLAQVAEKSPSCPMWDSNPRPPDFAPADLTTRLYGGRNTHVMGLRPLYFFLILSARGPCLEVRIWRLLTSDFDV